MVKPNQTKESSFHDKKPHIACGRLYSGFPGITLVYAVVSECKNVYFMAGARVHSIVTFYFSLRQVLSI